MNLKKHISPINNRRLMRLVGVLSFAALFMLPAGCTDDPEEGRNATSTITLFASADSFFEVNRAATRALPTGYISYNTLYPTTTPEHTTIGVFMTPERVDATQDFIYMGIDPGPPPHATNKWKSNVRVTDGTTYYIYGFMPKEDAQGAVVAPLNGDYSEGANLTIQGLNTLTPADVCLIVGVKKGTDSSIPIEDSGIQLGAFEYQGTAAGTNSVYLLLKHIYAGLHFKAHIDPTYAALRTIKVTKVELIADNIAEYINLSVQLAANTTGLDPIVSINYNPASTSAEATIQMFPWAGGPTEVTVPVTSPEGFLSCFAPGSCRNFTLRFTFNVYDKNDNLIRKDCVAENAINTQTVPQITSMAAGEIYTIDLLVKPDYLYVLSDPDLDNPTIKIQ